MLRYALDALRLAALAGLTYAIACGGNTMNFIELSDGDAATGANVIASGNTVVNPNSTNGNATSGNMNNTNNTVRKCPTPTTPVTYTNTTKTLINDHCLSCHASRTPKMTTYATAKTGFTSNGGQFDVQNGVMPPSSSETLDFETKCLFQAWEDNNYAQ